MVLEFLISLAHVWGDTDTRLASLLLLARSLAVLLSLSLSLSFLSLSLSHTHTHTRSLTHSHTHSLAHSLTLSLFALSLFALSLFLSLTYSLTLTPSLCVSPLVRALSVSPPSLFLLPLSFILTLAVSLSHALSHTDSSCTSAAVSWPSMRAMCSLLGTLSIPLLPPHAPGQAWLRAFARLLACPRLPRPRLVIASGDNGGVWVWND
jgi:hypothetical protein